MLVRMSEEPDDYEGKWPEGDSMLTIENRAGIDVLVMNKGAQPATEGEVALFAEVVRLRAEVEALRADAERYRHLRSRAYWVDERDMGPGGLWSMYVSVDLAPAASDGDAALDAAIDAARAAQGGE